MDSKAEFKVGQKVYICDNFPAERAIVINIVEKESQTGSRVYIVKSEDMHTTFGVTANCIFATREESEAEWAHRLDVRKAKYKAEMPDVASVLAFPLNNCLSGGDEDTAAVSAYKERCAELFGCASVWEDLISSGVSVGRMQKFIKNDRDGHLLILPCTVGDPVWYIANSGDRPAIEELEVIQITFDGKGLRVFAASDWGGGEFTIGDFGAIVFTEKQDAERQLAVRRKKGRC